MSRKCPNCKHVKDNSAFIDNKKICENCLENIRTRRAANPQKTKEIQHRNYMNHQEERKAKQRIYRSENLDAVRAYDRKRYPQRREKVIAYLRVYYITHHEILIGKAAQKRQACREGLREKGREYLMLHREEVNHRCRQRYATNPAWFRAKHCAFMRKNPHIQRRLNTLRRARMRGAQRGEKFDHLEIAERDGWRCHICHKKVTQKTWSLDHLIPIVDGGSHTRSNVALAHHRCNSKRGARRRIPAQLRLLG